MEFDVNRDPDIQGNRQVLQSILSVIDGLDGNLYTRPAGGPGSASIGKHVRHIVDFYECFLNGLPGGEVDYDARDRSPSLESSRQHARDRLTMIGERLAEVSDPDKTLLVSASSDDTLEPVPMRSSLRRELSFLCSHATHHLAVIALILGQFGLSVPPSLGVAASTIKHLHQTSRVVAD